VNVPWIAVPVDVISATFPASICPLVALEPTQ